MTDEFVLETGYELYLDSEQESKAKVNFKKIYLSIIKLSGLKQLQINKVS